MLFYFIDMKVCNKCKEEKELSLFGRDKKSKDKRKPRCKCCCVIEQTNITRTKEGKLKRIYFSQVYNSKTRKRESPLYTKHQFVDRFINDLDYIEHYEVWKASGYMKEFSPSFDRKDDYKPYSFDNIQIMFWLLNDKKGHKDRKEGINNKNSKAVVGTNIETGEKIEFHSSMEAQRNGFYNTNIGLCCKGKLKTSMGYTWEYKK